MSSSPTSPLDKKQGDPITTTQTVQTPNASDQELGGAAVPSYLPPGIDEKKLVRKIDWALIPFLSLLYLLSFLDRSAIGNAKLYGLEKELKLTDEQYNLCLTIFFFPYALFEVPSNILLKKLRPSVWFPLITFLVGVCMMSQGLVNNYGGLMTARFFLGVTEAGLFPGVNALLSGWYKRNEFGLRAAVFFSAATASGAFGGLLSAAIHNMDGVGGYSGWRWIFILIGIFTSLCGIAAIWLVQDYPETAKFLTEDERKAVIARLQSDQQFSAGGEEFQWKNVWKSILDWKTWVGMGMYSGCDGPLYAFSLFTPTVVKQLGYTATRANLVSVPIYVVACIFTVIVGFSADRTANRTLYNIGLSLLGMAGYAILIGNDVTKRPGVSYFGIYLGAIGIYPLIANTISLVAGNAEGAYKRSVVMAIVISWGNINGAVSSNIYPSRTGPRFRMGHGIVLGYIFSGLIFSTIYHFGVKLENRKRAQGLRDEKYLREEEEVEVESEVGDKSSGGVERRKTLEIRAKEEREKEISQEKSKVKSILRRLDMAPGGTYVDVDEARRLKGDEWSGFRYRA
ncbi:MFS general substrate transporter [Violaceomyces palustris]|uniref:MFS general substrate transporter n=1 Tax=Violaceomyces palustris TaxID=1673888 RepID=A0ACD0NN89_9BASI|nr:MFS general substrate transporter [Violaceomyces palustris]